MFAGCDGWTVVKVGCVGETGEEMGRQLSDTAFWAVVE